MIAVPGVAFCIFIAASGDHPKSGSFEEVFIMLMMMLAGMGAFTVPVGLYLLLGKKPSRKP
jgi:hypothetical protein